MVVLGGCGLAAISIKIFADGYGARPMPGFPLFMRDWGFVFLVVPAAWVMGTVWLERNPRNAMTKTGTIGTGVLVLIGLGFLVLASMLPPPIIQARGLGQ